MANSIDKLKEFTRSNKILLDFNFWLYQKLFDWVNFQI